MVYTVLYLPYAWCLIQAVQKCADNNVDTTLITVSIALITCRIAESEERLHLLYTVDHGIITVTSTVIAAYKLPVDLDASYETLN
jgi:hypothetical protein